MASYPQQHAHPTPESERERIREALLDLCFEHGYRHITLAMLLERAGLEEVDFRREYVDLEQCFYEVYAAALEEFRRREARAHEGLGSWRDRVRATAYALYRFVSEDERLRRLTTVEVRSGGERVQLLVGEEIEALFDLIDEGRREPGAPASLTRATAEQVGGGIFNQLYAAGARPGPMAPEGEIIPQQMYAVVLPYLGVEAAAEELSIPPPPRLDGEPERMHRALIELCFEHGFAGVTVEDLCARAEVGRSAFEAQYTDLEDCFCQTLETQREDFFAYLERAVALAGSERWADRVRAVAYGLLRYLRADRARTHFLTVELNRAGERATLIWTETIVKPLFDLIDEGRREPGAPASLTRATAEQVGGGIFNQLYTATGGEETNLPDSPVVPELMYAVVLPYLGPEAAAEELTAPPPPNPRDED